MLQPAGGRLGDGGLLVLLCTPALVVRPTTSVEVADDDAAAKYAPFSVAFGDGEGGHDGDNRDLILDCEEPLLPRLGRDVRIDRDGGISDRTAVISLSLSRTRGFQGSASDLLRLCIVIQVWWNQRNRWGYYCLLHVSDGMKLRELS